MYGNKVIPGIQEGLPNRFSAGLFVGYTESTWFDYVLVEGTDGAALPIGTVIKSDPSTGLYSPISKGDIISETANLPGVRLAVVADETAVTGKEETVDTETTSTPSSVLVGKQGHLDKAKILVGDTAFVDLTEAQQIYLKTQLEAWHFQLVDVLEA